MTKYTEEDLEKAYGVVRNTTACTDKVAQLIAETREAAAKAALERAAAKVVDYYGRDDDFLADLKGDE